MCPTAGTAAASTARTHPRRRNSTRELKTKLRNPQEGLRWEIGGGRKHAGSPTSEFQGVPRALEDFIRDSLARLAVPGTTEVTRRGTDRTPSIRGNPGPKWNGRVGPAAQQRESAQFPFSDSDPDPGGQGSVCSMQVQERLREPRPGRSQAGEAMAETLMCTPGTGSCTPDSRRRPSRPGSSCSQDKATLSPC